jgi:putative phosphoesterase
VWPEALAAFESADVILHAGDIHALSVIDDLSRLAPTVVARGNGEEGSGGRPVQGDDPRLRRSWLLTLGGLSVGLIHELPVPEMPQFPPDTVAFVKRRDFGTADVDVIVYGDSHVEAVDVLDRTLCVNPGSPTLPHNRAPQRGTVARLIIESGLARAEVFQITETGLEPVRWRTPDARAAAIARGSRVAGWSYREPEGVLPDGAAQP